MRKHLTFLFSLIIPFLFNIGCSFNSNTNDNSDNNNGTISAPVFSPIAGDYSEGYKEISISCDTTGADIFYSTDGKTPDSEDIRYTGAFKIIGSKTVKAIAIKGNSKSAVTTASFTLNAGKTQSQLGIITGTVNLASNLAEDVITSLSDSTIYIYNDDNPSVVKECKIGDTYYFDGLDTSKTYSFYFSNVVPGVVQGEKDSSRMAVRWENQKTNFDEHGKPMIAREIQVQPAEGSGISVDVDLTATGSISGVAKRFDVKGSEESDHSGIVVYIPGTSYSAYTDAEGNFTMTGIPQGSHTVRAQYAGYSFVEKSNVILEATSDEAPKTTIEDDFDLAFGKGIVKGNALLSDATSTDEMQGIDILITDSTNTYTYSAVTSTSGVYSMTDVYPGTYTVEISKDGYDTAIITEIQVVGAKVTSIPSTTLQVIGGSLSGTVSMTGKSDYSGISIRAESDSGKTVFAITDELGEFSWDNVSPGTYTISASYPGYKTSIASDIVVTIGGEVTGVIVPEMDKSTYSITGTVLLEGMSSFENTTVLIEDASTMTAVENVTTGTDGTFTASDIEPGEYLLTISRTGFITDKTVTVSIGTATVTSIGTINLKNALGAVKGDVTLDGAADNAGIAVLLSNQEEELEISYLTVTDSTGHYSISGVEPGTYKIQATKSGYTNKYSDAFTVSTGTTEEISAMILEIAQRSAYGTVTLEGRDDYAGVKITATNLSAPTEIYSALSNSDGLYALTGMSPSEYIVTYSYDGYVTFTGSSISLENDSSLKIEDVKLNKATGKISGIVNLEGCTDHSGINVSLVGTDYTCTTDENGSYEFTVPSGNYPGGVRFSKEDYQLTAKADTITVLTDSTYGVLTVEMKATANTVKGTVDLAGTEDDSGITVSIDEYPELISAITSNDGKWEIKHVPVNADSYVTIRFTRTNTPDVTTQIKVIANDYVEVSSIEMIPNAATLKGHAYLTDMTDHSNITVTVTTEGKDDIIVRTTSDGTFEATNILATGTHDIIFSKDGWDSQTITISDFAPMEERTMTDSINLVDTTAPVLSTVIIDDGVNFTNSSILNVKLAVSESGSGITKMAIQVKTPEYANLYPSTLDWQDYKVSFSKDLSEMPSKVYTGNGEYIVYVTLKDEAGNVSTTVSDSIKLANQASILKGVLTGTNLTLTKEKSPYRVEADCMVEEGSTMTIEPGVQIEFAGNYYIKINGSISAVGTTDEKIIFTRSNNYNSYWDGLKVSSSSDVNFNTTTHTYTSGCILKYCDFSYANIPLTLESGTYVNHCTFKNNSSYVRFYWASIIENNYFENGLYYEYDSGVGNSKTPSLFVNNQIYKYIHMFNSALSNFYNNDINNATISIAFWAENSPVFRYNNIVGSELILTGNSLGAQTVIFNSNNFSECSTPIVSCSILYTLKDIHDFTGNYWGAANTEELNLIGSNANASFISDYYDNYDYSKINYSSWATSEITAAGYKGNSFDWSTVE